MNFVSKIEFKKQNKTIARKFHYFILKFKTLCSKLNHNNHQNLKIKESKNFMKQISKNILEIIFEFLFTLELDKIQFLLEKEKYNSLSFSKFVNRNLGPFVKEILPSFENKTMPTGKIFSLPQNILHILSFTHENNFFNLILKNDTTLYFESNLHVFSTLGEHTTKLNDVFFTNIDYIFALGRSECSIYNDCTEIKTTIIFFQGHIEVKFLEMKCNCFSFSHDNGPILLDKNTKEYFIRKWKNNNLSENLHVFINPRFACKAILSENYRFSLS